MIDRKQGTGRQDGAPGDGLPTESADAGGRGVEGEPEPSAELGLIIPPSGPIQVEPIDSEVVAWTRRWTGARMVERLRLGTALISVASFLWLDEEGRLRRLAPNPRAGELVRKSSRPGMRLAVPLVGTVCVTGADTPAGGSRGLGVCQVLALRKAMGDWGRPE